MKKTLLALSILSISTLSFAEVSTKEGVFGKAGDVQIGLSYNNSFTDSDSDHSDAIALKYREDIDSILSGFGLDVSTKGLYLVSQLGFVKRVEEPYGFSRPDYSKVTNYDPGSAFFGFGLGYQYEIPAYKNRVFVFSEATLNHLVNPEEKSIEWEELWCEPAQMINPGPDDFNCMLDDFAKDNPDARLTSHMMGEMAFGVGISLTSNVDLRTAWTYKMNPGHFRDGFSDMAFELAVSF